MRLNVCVSTFMTNNCFLLHTEVTVGLAESGSSYGAVYTVAEGDLLHICVELAGSLERPVNVSIDGKLQCDSVFYLMYSVFI